MTDQAELDLDDALTDAAMRFADDWSSDGPAWDDDRSRFKFQTHGLDVKLSKDKHGWSWSIIGAMTRRSERSSGQGEALYGAWVALVHCIHETLTGEPSDEDAAESADLLMEAFLAVNKAAGGQEPKLQ